MQECVQVFGIENLKVQIKLKEEVKYSCPYCPAHTTRLNLKPVENDDTRTTAHDAESSHPIKVSPSSSKVSPKPPF